MKANGYVIKWKYLNVPYLPSKTECFFGTEFMFPTAIGETYCSKKDHFCRDTGRKISLARAMKNANLPKEERTMLWEAYRHMTKKERW